MLAAVAIPNYVTCHFKAFIQYCHALHQKRHQSINATSDVILGTPGTNLAQMLAAGRELFVTESKTQYQSAEALG